MGLWKWLFGPIKPQIHFKQWIYNGQVHLRVYVNTDIFQEMQWNYMASKKEIDEAKAKYTIKAQKYIKEHYGTDS